jgi:leucyl aminopeptidase
MLRPPKGLACERVLVVGCGKPKEFDSRRFRDAVSLAIKTVDQSGAQEAVCLLTELEVTDLDVVSRVRQAAELARLSVYRFDRLKSEAEVPERPLKKLVLGVAAARDVGKAGRAIDEGAAVATGMALARDLGNLPGNVCTPTYLAEQATEIAGRYRNIKCKVLEEKDMQKLGMGSLLSVAKGSRQPAKFIILEYGGIKGAKSAANKARPIVLVGKGITFDSGGISIKPSAAMDEMKFDMCGAASVLGTFSAIGELQPAVNVVGLVPSCENLPDGNANKPGDIVTSMAGKTIEVLNTDAEGRLILCDALTYSERYTPRAVVDIATLTGACVIALGSHASGLLGNDEKLVADLINAGNQAGDRAWQLPLWPEYQDQLKSNFADMANIGGREAGTITAACFLARFTEKLKWAHLDIAGTAWKSGNEKGATGRPVPLLTQFILNKVK